MIPINLCGAFLTACAILSAQQPQDRNENAIRMAAGEPPIYRATVTAKTAKAINYQHRSGATKIDFRGTELLPGARGEAKVESKQGYIEIEVEFDDLKPANKQGAEYLTYVLWAIGPEGTTSNLGEILLNGRKSKLNVTTKMQTFGLVVTAEPYYAVSQPSDLIVMENVVRAGTKGKIEEIDAKYELLQRGHYQRLANPLALKLDPKVPLELYEARNAVEIARAMGADRFAAETYEKARKSLGEAEAYQDRGAGAKPVAMTARDTVQTAEASRAIAVKRQQQEALEAERRQSAERETQARNSRIAAQMETERVTREAEAAQFKSMAEAERLKIEREAQRAAAAAEADRLKQENDTRIAAAALDAERLRVENDARVAAAKAEADSLKLESDSRLAAARIDADRLQKENEAQRAANQAELDKAATETARLETKKAELRTRLLSQFNSILETRNTARGLIVNMSGVLFDTGKSTLRPLAREKLAKVAGIVSSHPGLMLGVEGHTDNVGGDDFNQLLSERRGEAVRDYLTGAGIPADSVTSKGLGEAQPAVSNDTAQGRQQNRRVELVITGELIGAGIGATAAAR